MSSNLSSDVCCDFRTPKWINYSAQGSDIPNCFGRGYNTIYDEPIEKVPIERCNELAYDWKNLAVAYLNRLKDVPGDRFLLSEQMHHICNKFHSFVDKQGTFGKDEATFERLNQIGHCYWKMSNYFARIHCSGRKIYHNAARKIYEDALKISGEFVPTDPSAHSIRCLRYSISIAKLLKAGKFMREALETLIIGLSKAHRVKESNLGSEELVDIMWKANELLGKYMEELGV